MCTEKIDFRILPEKYVYMSARSNLAQIVLFI